MTEELKPGPGQQVVFQTQHFEAAFDEGENICVISVLNKDQPVTGRTYPTDIAGLVLEAVEAGYHLGVRDATRSLENQLGDLTRSVRAELGPQHHPRPFLRNT